MGQDLRQKGVVVSNEGQFDDGRTKSGGSFGNSIRKLCQEGGEKVAPREKVKDYKNGMEKAKATQASPIGTKTSRPLADRRHLENFDHALSYLAAAMKRSFGGAILGANTQYCRHLASGVRLASYSRCGCRLTSKCNVSRRA